MSNFVERATLQVIDKSSKPVKKIDRVLKKLDKTAKSLARNKGINLRVDNRALGKIKTIQRET